MLPVKKETTDNEVKMIIPCPASSPLKPAKKLYVVVAPTMPKGIKTRGYNIQKSKTQKKGRETF